MEQINDSQFATDIVLSDDDIGDEGDGDEGDLIDTDETEAGEEAFEGVDEVAE